MTPDVVPRLAPKARLRVDRRSGALLLLYPERGLALNESAAAVVRRCDGTRTVRQIARVLADGSGAAPDIVERDVADVIAELARRGLLAR